MKYLSKNGKEFNVEIIEDKHNDFYEVQVVDEEVMGYATFKININKNYTWLYKIVTNEKYQHMGVGQALLDIIEYISCKKLVRNIEGKFYPNNEYAKPFYEKNNYQIYKDGYDTYVGKRLDRSIVYSDIEPRIQDTSSPDM